MPFAARGESIRHLGIRLNTTPLTGETETFTTILGAVRATASHWAARNLTVIGRIHVAKQVLASKVTYHATFLPAPGWFIRDLTDCLQRFVTGGAPALRPCREAFALPWDKGGMRLVTVPTMVSSLQCKVVSRLLEPERLLWKQLLVSRLTLPPHWRERHPNASLSVGDRLGYGARLVVSTRRVGDLGINSARVLSYLSSYRQLQPHRRVLPQDLTRRQMLREPIFYNCQVTANSQPLRPAGEFGPLLSAGVTTVGDLSRDSACAEDLLARVKGCLPLAWRQALDAPTEGIFGDFRHPYHTDMVLTSTTSPLTWTASSIQADGRLVELSYCPLFDVGSLIPVSCMVWDPSRPWRPLTGRCTAAPDDPGRYFLGDETGGTFDPTLWGVGARPAHELVVREAADRLTTLAAVSAGVIVAPECPIRPAIWEGDVTQGRYGSRTLAATEKSWQQTIDTALLTTASPSGGVTRARDELLYEAAWMSPSRSRQHWRERQADAPPPPAAPTHTPPRPDTHDTCGPPEPAPTAPWSPVWARLLDLALERTHRLLAWQLLHGQLQCGAYRAFIDIRRGVVQPLEAIRDAAACPRPGCQGTAETVTHMLFACPTAARVWRWVLDLWAAVTDLSPPPLALSLLLADDQRQWRPPAGLQEMWTRLRLATIFAIHAQAQARRRGRVSNAPSVAAQVVGALRGAILRDWSRVATEGGIQGLAAGVCCSTWLRGRHPLLPMADFVRLWGHRNILAQVLDSSSGGRPHMSIRLSVSHPVPIPMGGLV